MLLLPLILWLGQAPADARQLLKLLDYLCADYSMAVEKGAVRSQAEYEELTQFHELASARLEEALGEAKDSEADSMRRDLTELGTLLAKKADAEEFETLARKMRGLVMLRFRINPAPSTPPSFDRGRSLYRENCAICHGDRGDGQSDLALNQDPPPANFLDPERIEGISPFRAFNVITFGVENTAMPGFRALEDAERWDLAYYLFTMRHPHGSERAPRTPSPESWQSLADRTDGELLDSIRSRAKNADPITELAWLRSVRSYESDDSLHLALRYLEDASAAAEDGRFAAVKEALGAAYLDGVEPVEPRLRVLAPGVVETIEEGFQRVRRAVSREAGREAIRTEIATLREEIQSARATLEKKDVSGNAAFWQSFLIIVREGIEAALLVATILGLLRAGSDRNAVRVVHWGWILALAAGGLLWWGSQNLIHITGADRETVEGVAALLAAAVLFYVSFWILSKADTARWMQFLKTRVESSLARKSLFALFGISFLAVFRESLETVLFYQALLQSSPQHLSSILFGLLAGTALLAALIWGMFRLGLRLPLKQFFMVSGALLYLLAFVMAGKGVWALQEAGWIGITPLSFSPIPWLGIFPSLEGSIAQGILIVAVLAGGLWLLAKRSRAQAA